MRKTRNLVPSGASVRIRPTSRKTCFLWNLLLISTWRWLFEDQVHNTGNTDRGIFNCHEPGRFYVELRCIDRVCVRSSSPSSFPYPSAHIAACHLLCAAHHFPCFSRFDQRKHGYRMDMFFEYEGGDDVFIVQWIADYINWRLGEVDDGAFNASVGRTGTDQIRG